MSDEDDSNIRTLGVAWKSPPSDIEHRTLEIINGGGCNHAHVWKGGKLRDAWYYIREGELEVECGICGGRVDPMFVLKQIARKESAWHHARKVYADEMKRLDERRATKCDHCGKMTRVSRAKRRVAK